MADVQCFWIEPTGQGHLQLRRYHFARGTTCAEGYHDARVLLPELVTIQRDQGFLLPGDHLDHEDPRWPQHCDKCDYVFSSSDNWTVDQLEDWFRPDTGAIVCSDIYHAPIGAMFDTFWRRSAVRKPQPDGITLSVQLPDGMPWCVDAPQSDGTGGWERTGDPKARPPTVSATPSIRTSAYHGMLTGGVLHDA